MSKDKDKDKGKEKKKHSKKPKDKKRKASKQKRKQSSGSGSASSSSSSSADEGPLSPRQQLKREQSAVAMLRDTLWLHKGARKDLRELLWTVDQGKAANTSGVPDPELKSRLQQLLKLLGLRRAGAKGVYALPKGNLRTLSIVGFVFEEQPRPPAAKPAPPPAAAAPPPQRPSPAAGETRATGGTGRRVPSAEVLAAATEAAAHAPAGGEDGFVEDAGESEEDEGEGGPGGGLLVGPPPPEMVEETDAAPEDAREAKVVRIMRVLRDARNAHESRAAAKGPLTAPAPGDVAQADAYAVLGVPPTVSAADVKKRYMRLSLLIHPDKCVHKDAHTAFQAVAAAAKTLQDAGKRGVLDAAREDMELRRMAEAEAVAQERARQWRVARGEEPASGPGSTAPRPLVRDSWMTDLPEENVFNPAANMLNQVSQTSFSQKGIKSRGDTTMWTDTPEAAAARAAQGGSMLQQGAAGPLMLTAGAAAGQAGGGLSAEDARIMDAFNSQARKRSLLDEHLARQGTDHKAKKSKIKQEEKQRKEQPMQQQGPQPASGQDEKSWVGKHPWKPFDKDKDLELKPTKPKDAQLLLQGQGGLGSKFSSSRNFL